MAPFAGCDVVQRREDRGHQIEARVVVDEKLLPSKAR